MYISEKDENESNRRIKCKDLISSKLLSCKFIIIIDAVLAFKKIPGLIRNYLFRQHKFFIAEFFLDLNSMLLLGF